MFQEFMVLEIALYLVCSKIHIVKWQGKQVIFPGLPLGLCLHRVRESVSQSVSAYDLLCTLQSTVLVLFHIFSMYLCLGIIRSDLQQHLHHGMVYQQLIKIINVKKLAVQRNS